MFYDLEVVDPEVAGLEADAFSKFLMAKGGAWKHSRIAPASEVRSQMQIPNSYYMIVDLEATCSNDQSFPRDEMEIIEIGAVMLSSSTFEMESEFQTFVRPIRHPQLTEFCISLTGIAQADVLDALSFPQALEAMKEWMSDFKDSMFCSWGAYDRKQFLQDCEFHQIAYPFHAGHLNLKVEAGRMLGRKPMGIGEAVRQLGMDFEGSHHRGLDDARNIARIVRRLCINAKA